jgi:hypothetical protein
VREDSKDWKKVVYPVLSGLILALVMEALRFSWNIGELGIYIDAIYLLLVIGISVIIVALLYRRVIQLRRILSRSNQTVHQLRREHTYQETKNILYESKFEVKAGEQGHVSKTFKSRDRIVVELWISDGDVNFYAIPDHVYPRFKAQRKVSAPDEPPPIHSEKHLVGHNLDSCRQVFEITSYNKTIHFVIEPTYTYSGYVRITLRITKLDYIRVK